MKVLLGILDHADQRRLVLSAMSNKNTEHHRSLSDPARLIERNKPNHMAVRGKHSCRLLRNCVVQASKQGLLCLLPAPSHYNLGLPKFYQALSQEIFVGTMLLRLFFLFQRRTSSY